MKSIRSGFSGVAWVLAAAACGPAVDADPGATFSDLETRLLDADGVSLEYTVTAEGAIEAELTGRLEVSRNGVAVLVGEGQFGGRAFDVSLHAEGERFQYSNGVNRAAGAQPVALRESLLVGLTRMGVLHNLARLTEAAPPDHSEGGVREWVTVGGFAVDAEGISFDLTVAGEPAGSATLELDESGLPAVRRQRVTFPDGEMVVTETYRSVAVTTSQ